MGLGLTTSAGVLALLGGLVVFVDLWFGGAPVMQGQRDASSILVLPPHGSASGVLITLSAVLSLSALPLYLTVPDELGMRDWACASLLAHLVSLLLLAAPLLMEVFLVWLALTASPESMTIWRSASFRLFDLGFCLAIVANIILIQFLRAIERFFNDQQVVDSGRSLMIFLAVLGLAFAGITLAFYRFERLQGFLIERATVVVACCAPCLFILLPFYLGIWQIRVLHWTSRAIARGLRQGEW